MRVLPREFFDRPVLEIAADLLGVVVEHGPVRVRVTEVEAYDGPNDPASHAFRGRTARNCVMFEGPGLLYVYFTYGMHWCANLVCGAPGVPAAVLLRAGEVVAGREYARERRPGVADVGLARGPANLVRALGLGRADNGRDVCTDPTLRALAGDRVDPTRLRTGPRVGIRAAAERPWRFWVADDPTVSAYRPAVARVRRTV